MKNLNRNTLTTQSLKKLVPALALGLFTSLGHAADLTVTVTSIEEANGEIMLAIYDSEDSFQKTVTQASRRGAAVGEVMFQFPDLLSGEYAIMVFHDINGNGELDTNLLGMPTEPWGASLQGKKLFGAPGWKDTRFALTDSDATITIKLN